MTAVLALFRAMLGSLRDLLPIVAVIAFFQLVCFARATPSSFVYSNWLSAGGFWTDFFYLWP